jgi:hypothetical protein
MEYTIRFAFKRDGEIIAPPRVTYASHDARCNSDPACRKYTVEATLGSAASKSFAALVGGAKKLTLLPGAVPAMARMNGRCQMTSPIPGLT